MLEIYQNQTNEPYIKLFYLNVTESETPFELELNDCPQTWTNGATKSVCTTSNFHAMVNDLIPGNWEEECGTGLVISADGKNHELGLFLQIGNYHYLSRFPSNQRIHLDGNPVYHHLRPYGVYLSVFEQSTTCHLLPNASSELKLRYKKVESTHLFTPDLVCPTNVII